MINIKSYEHYITGILTSIKKPAVIIPTIGILELTNLQLAIDLLIGLLFIDYTTGVLASCINHKKKIGTNFWKDSVNGFSSEKWKKSLVKIITYFLFILTTWCIEKVFQIKPFNTSYSNIENITITLGAIGLSCGIEFYSIFFENLPKAGFDIEKKFMKLFDKVKSIFTKVKNFNDEKTD
jgi:hypothetical protein